MEIEKTVLSIKENIAKSFSSIGRPSSYRRINPYPCCPDHDSMTEWYASHTWQEFEDILKEGTLDSEFMPREPDGYVYFLPAVLRYTLEAYEEKREQIWNLAYIEKDDVHKVTCAPISDWIRVLIPLYDQLDYRVKFNDVIARLENEQTKIIVEYLSFFLTVCPYREERFRNDIKRALDEVWLPLNLERYERE